MVVLKALRSITFLLLVEVEAEHSANVRFVHSPKISLRRQPYSSGFTDHSFFRKKQYAQFQLQADPEGFPMT
jgi:hypothetical protein